MLTNKKLKKCIIKLISLYSICRKKLHNTLAMSNERFYPKTIIKTFVLFFSKIFVKEVWEIERIPSDSHKRVNVSILNYLKNWAIDEVKMQQEYC